VPENAEKPLQLRAPGVVQVCSTRNQVQAEGACRARQGELLRHIASVFGKERIELASQGGMSQGLNLP
jgi:hypothetical protein